MNQHMKIIPLNAGKRWTAAEEKLVKLLAKHRDKTVGRFAFIKNNPLFKTFYLNPVA